MAPKKVRVGEEIYSGFANVPDGSLTAAIPSKVFSDEEFDNSPSYHWNLTSSRLTELAVLWSKELSDPVCDQDTPYICLVLATLLHEKGTGKSILVSKNYVPTTGALELPKIELELDPNEKKNLQRRNMESDDATNEERLRQARGDELLDNPASGTAGHTEEGGNDDNDDENDGDDIPEVSQDDIRFAAFSAAYMLKLVVKTVENVKASWSHMRERYASFYSVPIPEKAVPKDSFLRSFKTQLCSDGNICRSWIKIVVQAESELPAGDQFSGMLRFLSVIPLSFAGMHAFKLFFEVRDASKQTNAWLLSSMRSPATLPSLKLIAEIIIKHSSNQQGTSSPKFKYARLIGPEYYQELQTKNCPALVYLLVCILKEYRSFSGNQNPENIIGLDKLTASTKSELRSCAKMITLSGPTSNKDAYSSAMLEGIKAARANREETSSSDDEDESSMTREELKKKKKKEARKTRGDVYLDEE
ncbi:N protein [Rose virus R]|uniref:Nucleoprotein n=1 Tax=Rose virus R TaxID=2805917 RepID=A0AAE7TSQ4_9RHAB|nr:N protein [Rose virus R]QQZ02073.1 N protein [Rose virus R]